MKWHFNRTICADDEGVVEAHLGLDFSVRDGDHPGAVGVRLQAVRHSRVDYHDVEGDLGVNAAGDVRAEERGRKGDV